MSNNRFKTLTKLNIDYYEENTPVEIDKGVILLDTVSNQVLLQLKFRNISQYNINFIEIEVECFDSTGDKVSEDNVVIHAYQDFLATPHGLFGDRQAIKLPSLNSIEVECFDSTGDKVSEDNVVIHAYQDFLATPHGLFGDRQAIKLPSLNSRKVNINLKRVMFDNGEVVTFNQVEKIPNPSLTRVETLPADLRAVADPTIEYLPQDLGDNKWTCCCGRVNTNKTSCVRCGRDKEKQFKECDIAHLEQLAIQYKEKEIRLQQEKEERLKERQKMIRKLMPIGGCVVAVALVIGEQLAIQYKEKEIRLQQEKEERLKERQKMIRKLMPIGGCVVAVALVIGLYNNYRVGQNKAKIESQIAESRKDKEKEMEMWEEMGPDQFRIVQSEENLRDIYLNDADSMVKSTVRIYAENVVGCKNQCDSRYMTYEEAKDLMSKYDIEKKNGTYNETTLFNSWWDKNKDRVVNE